MEVALDVNNSNNSILKPIKEGLGSTCVGAGNLFNAIGDGLGNLSKSLSGSYNSYLSYPIFGFPFGYHHCHGGFFPGSVHGCMHGFWGIPTGPCHFTPIYAEPTPTFNFGNFGANLPSAIKPEDGQLFAPSKLQTPQFTGTSNPWATPIFGASPDFYLSLGLNPLEHTVIERGYNPTYIQPYPPFNGQPGVTPPMWNSPQSPQGVAQTIQNMTIDQFLHPEKYQQQSQQANSTAPKDDVAGQASANNCSSMGIDTPSYVSEIRNKHQNGSTLSPQEAELKKNFELLTTKYSPFEVDKDGNKKTDVNGNPVTNKIHKKIIELSYMIEANDIESIEAFVNKTSPMELASIEYYWNMVVAKGSETALNSKPLREMIKDACNHWGLKWTNKNTDEAEQIFNTLDEKTVMISPRSMAESLHQALENHRIFGAGFNEEKTVELLNKMKGNKVFAKAVLDEYRDKFHDNPRSIIRGGHGWLQGKWFASEETKELAREVFSMTDE